MIYCPLAYDIRHVDRERRGGGVAAHEITQFELLDCIIKVNKPSDKTSWCYSTRHHVKNGLKYENFAIEWSSSIE